MSRIRTIKPEFFTNDEAGALAPLSRLLFIGLWTAADKCGRVCDRPKRLKAELLPFDRCDTNKLLQQLHNAGLIRRYQCEGRKYIQITNFHRHQRPHPKEPDSHIPPPNDEGENVEKNGEPCNSTREPCKSSTQPGGKGREGKESKEGVCTEPAEPASVPTVPPAEIVMEFPVTGKDKTPWPLTQAKLDEYADSFPNIQVLAECKRARQWCLSNPSKRKTSSGMDRFLSRWLGIEQDRGLPRNRPPPADRFGGIKDFLNDPDGSEATT